MMKIDVSLFSLRIEKTTREPPYYHFSIQPSLIGMLSITIPYTFSRQRVAAAVLRQQQHRCSTASLAASEAATMLLDSLAFPFFLRLIKGFCTCLPWRPIKVEKVHYYYIHWKIPYNAACCWLVENRNMRETFLRWVL